MSDQRALDKDKEWNPPPERSHNLDSRLVLLVRFLARRAAEADFQASHGQLDIHDTQGD